MALTPMGFSPEQLAGAGVLAALAGMMLVFVLIAVVVFYVYFALVLSTLAKKLKYKNHWLAWIPLAQLALFPILAKGKERFWPWVFIFLIPIVGAVFYFIWSWKIFEKRKYPGWLCLLPLLSFIPFLGLLAGLGNLVVWGIVAWVDR